MKMGTHGIVLAENGTPLAVPEHGPCNVGIDELRDANLARKGAVWLVEDVLRRHLDALAQVLARQEQVEGRGGDDDLGVWVELGAVEVLHNLLDLLDGAVPKARERRVSGLRAGGACAVWGREDGLVGWGRGACILKLPPTKN